MNKEPKPLPVYMYGCKILTERCRPVEILDTGDPFLENLIAQMKATVRATDIGIGITAPQVGHAIRLFIICDKDQKDFKVYINPVIIALKGSKHKDMEGCLSIPKAFGRVERYQKVKIKYYDEDLIEHIELVKGFDARVIQHEFDHLEGKLFIDRIPGTNLETIGKGLNVVRSENLLEYEVIWPNE